VPKTLFPPPRSRVARSVRVAWLGRRGAFQYLCINRAPETRLPCQARVGESPVRFTPRTFAKGHSQRFRFWLALICATIFEYMRSVAICPPDRAESRGCASNGLTVREECRAVCLVRGRRAIAVFPPA